ncbi:MAG TPA: hypothetical protein VGL71_10660 [Urbifossiella sp.]
MISVSSLRNEFLNSQGKLSPASAASTSARLVMLLLPGTETVADGGFVSGSIASSGGYLKSDMVSINCLAATRSPRRGARFPRRG